MPFPKTRTALLASALSVAGFLVGRGCRPGPGDGARPAPLASAVAEVWTCSMHPQVRLPEPGQCPICFMNLIPASSGGGGPDLGPRVLQLSESARALAEVETAAVERRSVAHEVDMVGKIALDETRMAYITSWVAGRLDRLFVDYTGVTVRADDHLVEIYSPTLYSAQQEFLQAIATAKKLEGSSLDILRSTSDRTVVSSREKLRLYGLNDEQIREIVERGVPNQHVTIRAPIGGVVVHKSALEGMYVDEGSRIYTIADLSKVWVLLDAYESDLAWLRYGQDVEFRIGAYPAETFHGRIAFIDPLLDDRTRTVKVRLNVDNPDGRLKPDMFVSARAHAVLTSHGKVVDRDLAGKWMCPMHPEVVDDALGTCSECGMALVRASELGFITEPTSGDSLVIPHTAPLVTGKRAVVYVRLPDFAEPTFEGREIALGPRAGEWYVVDEGLREGELVVVRGNFKLDSELQIRARPSMMSSSGPPASEGHAQHDAHDDVPLPFRRGLGGVLDAYLELQARLAADQDGSAAARALRASLDAADMAELDGENARATVHLAWMEQRAGWIEAAQGLVEAPGIAERRLSFARFSALLIESLTAFGYEREAGRVAVFHCPMALDGDGADWIQESGATLNPYFGAQMLRCGSQTARLGEER